MADKNQKVSENVEGSYYVTEECSACGICVDSAPENLKMNDDDSYAYVFKQSGNDEEKAACEEALDSCPSDAIGNDG